MDRKSIIRGFSKTLGKSYKNRKLDSLDKLILPYLATPYIDWNSKITVSKEYPRSWKTIIDIETTLSDGFVLKIPKGTIWDGASIPKWLWWLFKPIDEAAIGDLIHDELWRQKQGQLEYFNFNIHEARKFSDLERLKWRNKLAPKKKIKNYITHFVIRLIGGFFYSKQIKIPN